MMPIRRVLCPVDFSEFSRKTIEYAVAIASWYGATLTVQYVHYFPDPAVAMFAGLATGAADRRALSPADREYLRTELQSLLPRDAASRIPIRWCVAEGEVVTEILAEAEAADLLVIGTHGRSGFERLVIGSVAEKVLRKAACSILTIPRGAPGAVTSVPMRFHHILVAVDFSKVSLQALTLAVTLAEEADAHLTVLHVTEVPRYLSRWTDEAADGQDYVNQWKAQARARLRTLVADAVRVYAHVDERAEVGVPYREILRVGVAQQSDLIVIGVHGEDVLEPRFVGSTTQHVVRQAPCPVLTVRGA